jgi:murein tripeptide amidase MpaA
MKVSSQFDAGNIICLNCDDPQDIRLEIKKDNLSDFYQWFYFRLSGARDVDCRMVIVNAGGAAYAKGWEGYSAAASYDRENWFRVPADYDGTALVIRHKPERDGVYYAYFAPYSMERHGDLVARAVAGGGASLQVLGQTLDGQDIDLLSVGTSGAGKRNCWIIGRQHPGETMAEWLIEGFIDRLLDQNDAVARALLAKAVFYIVPNMNPDGSRRGHLRTNAAGANLNREWQTPTMEHSPEVYLVRQEMKRKGVDFCLDVHGDEDMPYNFIAGTEGIPSFTATQHELLKNYKTALKQANPDFQAIKGYPRDKPGKANMTVCTAYIAEYFNCLAMTLEQPFKDTLDTPDPQYGWSPARAKKLGAAQADALYAVIHRLR